MGTARGRGAVLVLAIFTRRIAISEFLTLPSDSGKIDPKSFEIGGQLGGGLELDAAQTEALCCFYISGNVINVKGFLGTSFNGSKRFAVDERIRFAGAHGAGIDAGGKEGEETVSAFQVTDVNRICVGQ